MTTPYVGEIRLLGFSRVPTGWLACDGSLQSIANYETLYTLLGTTYGGDGQNTFAVPDLRGQLPMHNGTGQGLTPRVIGEFGGSEQVTLLSTHLPAHTHSLQVTSAVADTKTPGNGVQPGTLATDTMYATDISGLPPLLMNPAAVSPAGGSLPHDNLMPAQTLSFCIAWAGVYPSQN